MPTGFGLKLRYMSDLTVVSGVTPAGRGIEPLGALVGDPPFAPICACTGIAIVAAIASRISAVAIVVLFFGVFIFFFSFWGSLQSPKSSAKLWCVSTSVFKSCLNQV